MARAPRVAVATSVVTAPATAAPAVVAPPAAPTPDAPVLRPYRVLSRLKWAGERHGVGATVEMTEAEAETLVALGILAEGTVAPAVATSAVPAADVPTGT